MSTVSYFFIFTCPARDLFIKVCLIYLDTNFLTKMVTTAKISLYLGLLAQNYEKQLSMCVISSKLQDM